MHIFDSYLTVLGSGHYYRKIILSDKNKIHLESYCCICEKINKVDLDLSACSEYSIFPDQIVMVEGTNPDGTCLKVSRFLQPGTFLFKPSRSKHSYGEYSKYPDGVLKVLIATGASLESISLLVAAKKPQTLILCGPFNNSKIPDCMLPNLVIHIKFSFWLKSINEMYPFMQIIVGAWAVKDIWPVASVSMPKRRKSANITAHRSFPFE